MNIETQETTQQHFWKWFFEMQGFQRPICLNSNEVIQTFHFLSTFQPIPLILTKYTFKRINFVFIFRNIFGPFQYIQESTSIAIFSIS